MRWILKLQENQFEVEHKPGKDHTDADGVSRLVAATSPLATLLPHPRQGWSQRLPIAATSRLKTKLPISIAKATPPLLDYS